MFICNYNKRCFHVQGCQQPWKKGGSDQDVGWWDERDGAAWAQRRRRETPLGGFGGMRPQEIFETLAPKSMDSEGIFMPSIGFFVCV